MLTEIDANQQKILDLNSKNDPSIAASSLVCYYWRNRELLAVVENTIFSGSTLNILFNEESL